jgi:hypothetical protein
MDEVMKQFEGFSLGTCFQSAPSILPSRNRLHRDSYAVNSTGSPHTAYSPPTVFKVFRRLLLAPADFVIVLKPSNMLFQRFPLFFFLDGAFVAL